MRASALRVAASRPVVVARKTRRDFARIRNASYRAQLRDWREPVSNQVATSDLKAMVDAGLLMQHGQKRGTYYSAAPLVGALSATVRSERQPIDAARIFKLPIDDPNATELPFNPEAG